MVGRDDTGELEAQVRGSRHAWDIRLISADALIKLVQLKENSDSLDTGRKIRSLLSPMEYTRPDELIDVMFTTAVDIEGAIISHEDDDTEGKNVSTEAESGSKGVWEFTDSNLLQAKREKIIKAFGDSRNATLIKKSRALYWDAAHELRLACSISKRYLKRQSQRRWTAGPSIGWKKFPTINREIFLRAPRG